jgi:hypothetical protein
MGDDVFSNMSFVAPKTAFGDDSRLTSERKCSEKLENSVQFELINSGID